MSGIKDLWFYTGLKLDEVASILEMSNISRDAENIWEWVLGEFEDATLDITRKRKELRVRTPTRILQVDHDELPDELVTQIVSRLRKVISDTIFCGEWEYLGGEDFNLLIFKEFAPGAKTKV